MTRKQSAKLSKKRDKRYIQQNKKKIRPMTNYPQFSVCATQRTEFYFSQNETSIAQVEEVKWSAVAVVVLVCYTSGL